MFSCINSIIHTHSITRKHRITHEQKKKKIITIPRSGREEEGYGLHVVSMEQKKSKNKLKKPSSGRKEEGYDKLNVVINKKSKKGKKTTRQRQRRGGL